MNGINTLDIPTINGLKNLQLDQIDTSILNADTIILENVQTSNLIVNDEIIFLSGSSIVANSLNISDIEISYLDGLDGNIQIQINSINSEIDTIDDTLINLQDQIDVIDLTLIDIQETIDVIPGLISKTQNQSSILDETTFEGNLKINDGNFIFSDSTIQTTAFTNDKNTMLTTVNGRTAFITSYQISGEPPSTVMIGNIDTNFINIYDGYGRDGKIIFPDTTQQTTAFTNEDKAKVDQIVITDGLISATKIATGIISNTEFNCLDNCDVNIKTTFNSINTVLNNLTRTKIYGQNNFTSKLVSGSDDFYLPNNTEYDVLKTYDTTSLFYASSLVTDGAINSSKFITRRGRYLVKINIRIVGIKWYIKFLAGCKTWFGGVTDFVDQTLYSSGTQLDTSSENESEFYVNHVYYVIIGVDTPTYIRMFFDLRYSTAISGDPAIYGQMELIEL